MCKTRKLFLGFIFQKGGEISFEGFKRSSPSSSGRTHAYAEYVRHVIHVTGSVRLQKS